MKRIQYWPFFFATCLLYCNCSKKHETSWKEIIISADTDSIHHNYINSLSFDISETEVYNLQGVNHYGHFYCMELSGNDNERNLFSGITVTLVSKSPFQTGVIYTSNGNDFPAVYTTLNSNFFLPSTTASVSFRLFTENQVQGSFSSQQPYLILDSLPVQRVLQIHNGNFTCRKR